MLLATISNFNLLVILLFTTIAILPNYVTGRVLNDDYEYKNEVIPQNKEPVQKIKKVIENTKDWVLKEADNLVLEIEDVAIPYGTALSKTLVNEVKISVGQLKKYFSNLQSYNGIGNCTCHSYTCGCCIQPDVPEIHLHSKLCSNISYLPDDYGFTFTITLDSHVLINKTISVHNPPPICVTPPYVEKLIDLCLRFFDVNASKTNLHACVQVELSLKGLILAHYDLGCYDVGPKTIEEFVYYEVKLI